MSETETDSDPVSDADSHSGSESPPSPRNLSDLAPFIGMGALFVAVPLFALALVPTFDEAGLQATPNPEDPTNSLLYFGAILVFTAFILFVVKRGVERVLQAIILLSVGVLTFYTLSAVVALFVPETAALVGASNPKQARENAQAADIELSDQEYDAILQAFEALGEPQEA